MTCRDIKHDALHESNHICTYTERKRETERNNMRKNEYEILSPSCVPPPAPSAVHPQLCPLFCLRHTLVQREPASYKKSKRESVSEHFLILGVVFPWLFFFFGFTRELHTCTKHTHRRKNYTHPPFAGVPLVVGQDMNVHGSSEFERVCTMTERRWIERDPKPSMQMWICKKLQFEGERKTVEPFANQDTSL